MTLLRDADLAEAFDHASGSYDLLVAANPGYHAHLRRSVRRLGLSHGGDGLRVLDLGCGTGASTAALAAVLPGAEITAVDASAGMLDRAAAKPWPGHVTFVHAPAEGLAEAGVRGPFDAVFAGYLLRNAADPDAVLRAVREVLAPHGRLAVHEYTLSGRARHRAVWTAVCGGVVLPVASALGDGRLYRHLWRSVVEFDTAGHFADRVRAAGFDRVRVLPLPGWQTGITHTVVGRRPGTGQTDAGAASGGGRSAVPAGAGKPPAADRGAPEGGGTPPGDGSPAQAGGRAATSGTPGDAGTDRVGPEGGRVVMRDARGTPGANGAATSGAREVPGAAGAATSGTRGAPGTNRLGAAAGRAVDGGVRVAPADKGYARVGERALPDRGGAARDRTGPETGPAAPAGDR
ncbi:hypothetical protein GCM10010145_20640 [Streptomyces ruber]|uniref:Ubiquinone biosynthesis methyltransferase UbiE n=2 Tax=Streptomyces TaxID=1883 RepID=A0A918B9W9_9ACTN|nr:hypothetical protein GCM10010145_20640 [Streptomyces ruber]